MTETLQQLRLKYEPKLPKILLHIKDLYALPGDAGSLAASELSPIFPTLAQLPLLTFAGTENLSHPPLKVGIVLSGGQAAGGHNVISGLFDALKKLNPSSQLYGYLNGPSGIVEHKYIVLTEESLSAYRNQGGFDLLGSGRTKIETPEQFQAAKQSATSLNLDGLVVVGGDDSNTNAAFLAEYFHQNKCKTKVVGAPKTIDGDLKNEYIETSFGFDSACKTYSELIGNVLRDALSQKKYYFFIKLMGRSASHIALECALQTQPNMTLIGEEVEAKKLTIADITKSIADMICRRAEQSKEFGVVLIPEGIIEFIPECKTLIGELNNLLASSGDIQEVIAKLSGSSKACFESLPGDVQNQLLLDRDPHGNVQVSKIESDRLFLETVKKELNKRKKEGSYKGKFSAQPLFYGYEGRSCFPSNFDAQYCYALGHVSALLINQGCTGYMGFVQKLFLSVEEWQIGAVPLVKMMHMEKRKGELKPVIRKALVDLKGRPFAAFSKQRENWMWEDDYRYPGPIQFFGPPEVTDLVTQTLHLVP
jgi:diphosphate-dependent phosphofructokinase